MDASRANERRTESSMQAHAAAETVTQTVAIEAQASEPLALPTVHLNGSGRKTLADQLEASHLALTAALEAMRAGAPNGRDYYPQGSDAFERARVQHVRRLGLVEGVQAELLACWEGLSAL